MLIASERPARAGSNDAIQLCRKETSGSRRNDNTHDQSGNDHEPGLPKDHVDYSAPLRTKSHTDAELVCSSSDIIRKHAVDTESCENKGDQAEHCADIRDQLGSRILYADLLIQRLRVQDGKIFI